MANAAAKKLAAQNEAAIKKLNIGMGLVNLNWILLRHFLHTPSFPWHQLLLYLLTLAPSLLLYRYLVRSGTPTRSATGELLAPGEDLGAPGVVEWSWDIIFVTWGCALGSAALGGWVWWFYLLIPGYAAYKGGSFLLPFLRSQAQQFSSLASAAAAAGQPGAGAGAGGEFAQEGGQPESKRQQKLRKRMEKGDPRVRQVERKRPA